MSERFDDMLIEKPEEGYMVISVPYEKTIAFIEQEIKKEREEIVEMIIKQEWSCFEQKEDIINTIKNKYDKQ